MTWRNQNPDPGDLHVADIDPRYQRAYEKLRDNLHPHRADEDTDEYRPRAKTFLRVIDSVLAEV